MIAEVKESLSLGLNCKLHKHLLKTDMNLLQGAEFDQWFSTRVLGHSEVLCNFLKGAARCEEFSMCGDKFRFRKVPARLLPGQRCPILLQGGKPCNKYISSWNGMLLSHKSYRGMSWIKWGEPQVQKTWEPFWFSRWSLGVPSFQPYCFCHTDYSNCEFLSILLNKLIVMFWGYLYIH